MKYVGTRHAVERLRQRFPVFATKPEMVVESVLLALVRHSVESHEARIVGHQCRRAELRDGAPLYFYLSPGDRRGEMIVRSVLGADEIEHAGGFGKPLPVQASA